MFDLCAAVTGGANCNLSVGSGRRHHAAVDPSLILNTVVIDFPLFKVSLYSTAGSMVIAGGVLTSVHRLCEWWCLGDRLCFNIVDPTYSTHCCETRCGYIYQFVTFPWICLSICCVSMDKSMS